MPINTKDPITPVFSFAVSKRELVTRVSRSVDPSHI